jgi:glycosyltransferase involved in cell wall biosynthesis
MRILFVLTQDISSPSGIGRYFPLAKELAKLGNELFVLALHPDFRHQITKRHTLAGVNIKYVAAMHVKKVGNVKSYYSPLRLIYQSTLATIKLTQNAWKIPVDIVHIGKPHPMNGIAGLVKGIQKNQVYVDCDDDEAGSGVFRSDLQRKIIDKFEKTIPRYTNYVTTNTHYTENRLIENGIDPKRIIYLSSGVDMDRFRTPDPSIIQDLRVKHGLLGYRVIAYIGSLSLSSHPVNLLLCAFNLVLQEKKDTKLLVVGGGDDYNHLQDDALRIGITNSVIFVGHVSAGDVVNYYYLSDMVVDPVLDNRAARGRQPLKLFESWACGIPYISAGVGDRSELLGSPPAGMLAKPGDAQSLAKTITQLLDNPQLSDQIRQLGKRRVIQYTWDNLAAQLNAEYLQRLPG